MNPDPPLFDPLGSRHPQDIPTDNLIRNVIQMTGPAWLAEAERQFLEKVGAFFADKIDATLQGAFTHTDPPAAKSSPDFIEEDRTFHVGFSLRLPPPRLTTRPYFD